MSRSVSAPSSVTNTSPCWNGFMVPGSTFRYGSSFCIVTRSPRAFSSLPSEEAVRPLPSEEATPPVTNRWQVSRAKESSVLGSKPALAARKSSLTAPGVRRVPTRGSAEVGYDAVGLGTRAVVTRAARRLLPQREDRPEQGHRAAEAVDVADARGAGPQLRDDPVPL